MVLGRPRHAVIPEGALIRLSVRCVPETAERVLEELLVLAPNGVEEDAGPGWVEYAIYGAAGELPDLGALRAASGNELVEVHSAEVPDDWADRWRDFHRPTAIAGGRLVVRPSWDKSAGTAPLEIVIDPGRAFGTGAHPTTRMCLELLLELGEGAASGSLADLGTGSGLLAISAAKVGFDPVVAVDHEPAALDAARANAGQNGVELELRRLDLRQQPPPIARTVVANLTAPLLRDLATRLPADGDPRTVLCAGLLTSEEEGVASAFAERGLALSERRASGEWAALLFARRDPTETPDRVRP